MPPTISDALPKSDVQSKKQSLTERTVSAGRQVLAGQHSGVLAYLAFVGPAVIVSIAYMDPGNFATNIQAGAKYGYGLLWVVLLANLIAMLFQALSAKLGIVTGRNLAEMCREQFPQPVVWAMWAISEIAAQIKKTRDKCFVAKNAKGQTVNRNPGIAWIGGCTDTNEFNYLQWKVITALGVPYRDSQARV